jgi:ankyrin repeat protein
MYAGDREYGVTPLWLASKYGYLDVVKYLIENGADIDQPNIHGATPLSGASEYGHLDVAKYLKKKGAK